jgi:hypothetical protein
MDGADGARLATVVYRWRDLGASGDRLEFLIGMSEGYGGGSSKHWTLNENATSFETISVWVRPWLSRTASTYRKPNKGGLLWLTKMGRESERRRSWR